MCADFEISGQRRRQRSMGRWMPTPADGGLGVGMGFDGETAVVNMKAPGVVGRKCRTCHKP